MQLRPSLNRIDSYIVGQLVVALFLVTAGLVALIWLTQSLRFIQIIVEHGLSPLVFIKLTFLLVPSFVSTILPITCFIVVLFIYTRLAGDRELTIMRTLGLSDLSLARPALGVAFAAMLAGYALTLGIVPVSLNAFRSYQYEIRSQIAAFLLQPGVFTPVSSTITVYVQARGTDDSLHGILIEDESDPAAPATILARSGQLSVTAQGPMLVLQDGSRQQIDSTTGRLDVLTFQRNIISLAQTAKAGSPGESRFRRGHARPALPPQRQLNPRRAGQMAGRGAAPAHRPARRHQLFAGRAGGDFGRRVPPPWRIAAHGRGRGHRHATGGAQPGREQPRCAQYRAAAAHLGHRPAARAGCRLAAAAPGGTARMMRLPITLSVYFGRQFSATVAAMLAALTALVALFDFLELLRESATAPQASFAIIAEIEILRLPWSVLQILPFAVLLGGIYAFWRLARSSELVVARAAGISAWQFLAVPVLLATLFGAAATGIVSPLSAMMYSRAELLDDAYLHAGGGPLSLNGGQLWVRQSDAGLVQGGVAVLHAANVHLSHNLLQADHVSILRLDSQTGLLARIEARHATLNGASWDLADVNVLQPGAAPQRSRRADLPHRPHRAARRGELRLARTPSPSGRCRASSPCSSAPASPPPSMSSPSRPWPPCRCCAPPWRWLPPASPCARPGAPAPARRSSPAWAAASLCS